MTSSVPVLVAHDSKVIGEALASALAQARPDYAVRHVPLDAVDRALGERPATVVASGATAKMQQLARGWIVLVEQGRWALIGTGDQWSTVRDLGLSDLIGAIDRLARHAVAPQA